MRPILSATAALLAVAIVAVAPQPVLSQAVQLVVVDVKAVAHGYRVSKLTGSTVINEQRQDIGTIDDFIIDQDKVMFVVLEVGGILGLGGHLVAVPYASLKMEDQGRKIVLPGATKDSLGKLPVFEYAA